MRPITLKLDANGNWIVKRGVTFLAVVSFDGPRGSIVTHEGMLRADERREVYRAQQEAASREVL